MIIKGSILLLAFVSIWAALIWAMLISVAEDENISNEEMTPEELAEERNKYACYEDTEIES